MKKILFYINVLWKGGAERVILQLAIKFQEAGYDVLMITSFKDENEYVIPPSVRRITLEKQNKPQNRLVKNISRIIKLRKVIKEQKADYLISFMAEPNFRSVIANAFLKTKVIISVRNDPQKEYSGFINKLVAKTILPFADGCVFQTKDAQNYFPLILQKKSKIIFNEVSESFFNIKRSKEVKDIVSIGRLSEQKNQLLLIKSFECIKNKYPDTNLRIYGDGDLKPLLNLYITEHGLTNRVFLEGVTDNVPDVLSRSALFVLSSNYEGMPNALLEAMAGGVPVISSDCPCGGPKMIIEDGVNGLLFPVGDGDCLIKAIDKILSNSQFRADLGKNAREYSIRFSPKLVFEEWSHFVNSI